MQLPQETVLKCVMCKRKYESLTFQKAQEKAIPADAGDGEPLPKKSSPGVPQNLL